MCAMYKKQNNDFLGKIKEFDNIYIFIERNKEYPYEMEGRIHDEKQSDEISNKLKDILKEFDIKYITFRSDKSNIQKMLDYILN
jgi:hypothetical protein